jgi:hypothetical protein
VVGVAAVATKAEPLREPVPKRHTTCPMTMTFRSKGVVLSLRHLGWQAPLQIDRQRGGCLNSPLT